jgi:hypothetical protein
MKTQITRFFLVAFLYLNGCGGPDSSTPPDGLSPAEQFDQVHGGKTITPHGRILGGSAKNGGDGSVIYQTEDNKKWHVNRRTDGTYGTPKELR